MNSPNLAKIVLALAMLGVAGFFFFRFLREGAQSEKAFFFDLSAQKLFTAPRTAVPPIKGTDDAQEDAVRAVVISASGDARDKSSWKVAYLEKYSAELKKQMEAAQVSGSSPQMGRALAQGHRFVKRLSDAQWFSMNTAEGERIVTEWTQSAQNGVTPVVCTP
ncbi:MAG: hypothetical protein FJ403_11215 [Verrucomicrobia bacterium]|nr:hypothetical protein [Verrucomicrobiota bacterium]